jgi:hypothetical protein
VSEKIRIRHVARDIDICRHEDIFVCSLTVSREDPSKLRALEAALSRPWLTLDAGESVSIENQLSEISDVEILAELQRRLSRE